MDNPPQGFSCLIQKRIRNVDFRHLRYLWSPLDPGHPCVPEVHEDIHLRSAISDWILAIFLGEDTAPVLGWGSNF